MDSAPVLKALEALIDMGFIGGLVVAVIGGVLIFDKILHWRQMLKGRTADPKRVDSLGNISPMACARSHTQMGEGVQALTDGTQTLTETIHDLVREVKTMREFGQRDASGVQKELQELAREIRDHN